MFRESPAYRSGYSANYFGGASLSSNMFEPGTSEYNEWRKGWFACDSEHCAA